MGQMYFFLAIVVGATFTFTSIAASVDARRKEREAYYKNDTMRRLAEMPGEGAKHVIEFMREQERIDQDAMRRKERKRLEGLKIGGIANIAIGIGLSIFLYSLGAQESPYLVGLLPGLIGVALLVYTTFLAPKIEEPTRQP